MFSKFAKLRKVWKGNSRKIRTQGTGTDFFEAGSLSRPQSVFNVGPELTPCPYLCRNCLPENWHQRAEANCYADTFAVNIMHLKSTDELVCLWSHFTTKFVPQLSLCIICSLSAEICTICTIGCCPSVLWYCSIIVYLHNYLLSLCTICTIVFSLSLLFARLFAQLFAQLDPQTVVGASRWFLPRAKYIFEGIILQNLKGNILQTLKGNILQNFKGNILLRL